MSSVRPPTYIALPPPPVWQDFQTDPPSPYAQFYTPPTSPAPSPTIFFTPPTSPFHDPDPPASAALAPPHPTDDLFPTHVDLALDLGLGDDGLSTLEKIYLYSCSRASFHRVFIAHALPDYLLQVTPQEAIEYVLPLLSGLAMDTDERVKEALTAELVPVIWWFFTHCQIIPDDPRPEDAYASSSITVTISVQAFTPILGTLLLSNNPQIGSAARQVVVDLLSRMRKVDEQQGAIHRYPLPRSLRELHHPWHLPFASDSDMDEDEEPLEVGLFGRQERAMFTQELLHRVVIGMAHLDQSADADSDQQPEALLTQEVPMELDRSNPYFPPSPSSQSLQSHGALASRYSSLAAVDATISPRFASPENAFRTPSPGVEYPPAVNEHNLSSPRSPPAFQGRQGFLATGVHPMLSSSALHGPEIDTNDELDDITYDDEDEQQAAMGRLSSMSLMAAVTASGPLEEQAQRAFVEEIERVAKDPVQWVRREASFAIGALAKVVPSDLVTESMLPLFYAFRRDPSSHVRHSALFALPGIIARLPAEQRRSLALETVLRLADDENAAVRLGVLEALGEVIYTFHEDPEGPPQELIDLFLRRRENQGSGQQLMSSDTLNDDPKKDLICAFNFPAVALTLGAHRWGELRDAYLKIHDQDSPGVRHTFSASIGELAKIIGPEHAENDLVDVWQASIKSDDEEVRSNGIKSTATFVEVIGKKMGTRILEGLLSAWDQGCFRGWRERGLVMQNLVSWVNLIGLDSASPGRAFFVKALEDNVAAVRETAISIIPDLYSFCSSRHILSEFLHDLNKLSTSSNYRRRMTFIACQQSLFLATSKDGKPLISCNDDFLRSVANFANDAIEGVRIGISRFAALVHVDLIERSQPIPSVLQNLIQQLSQDASHEVRSYVAELSSEKRAGNSDASLSSNRLPRKQRIHLATFSRPPPAPPYAHSRSIS